MIRFSILIIQLYASSQCEGIKYMSPSSFPKSITSSVSIRMAVSVGSVSAILGACAFAFEFLKIPVRAAEHPYREGEFEVGICDRDVLVEHALDRFLWP